MRNIAIFCDGTWQSLGQRNPTNVARLARSTQRVDGAGQAQIIRYDDGIGVGQGVLDNASRLLGGALGKGLDYKLARAYEFLSLNYEPGDRIFLFGFSRGAYTVRSLAGLLRQLWILKPEHSGRVIEATELYRDRPKDDAKPAKVEEWVAEVRHFHELWCHPIGNVFTDQKPFDPKNPDSLVPADPKSCGWIQYLGVWDTVGSLGIPSSLPFADVVDDKYEFHDLKLSRFVRSARHAVALDERRDSFKPTLWGNLPALNDNAGAGGRTYGERPYQQKWFPGVHGSVGGGGASPVSFPPLLWIAEGAARAGLELDAAQLAWFAGKADPDADLDQERFDLGALALKAVGSKWRTGPTDLDEISPAAVIRILGQQTYAPGSLTPQTLAAIRKMKMPKPTWYAP